GQRVPISQARSTSRPCRRVSRARIQCPLRERRRGKASPFTRTWNGPNRPRISGDVGHDIFTTSGLPLPGAILAPPALAFRYRVTLFLAVRVLRRDARLVECGRNVERLASEELLWDPTCWTSCWPAARRPGGGKTSKSCCAATGTGSTGSAIGWPATRRTRR